MAARSSFAAFTPALLVSVANSSPTYVGTAVINGVTVTLTATGGDGLARWSANNDGLYLNGTDSFRLDFSKPVRLAITTSAFGDPLTVHERFCGVTAATVPWQAVKLVDCNGNVSVVDPDTRLPISDRGHAGLPADRWEFHGRLREAAPRAVRVLR